MATFMMNGPPSAPLMAVGAAFYGAGAEGGAVEDAMDEMDMDHFNELDKIFDLPLPPDGNDPFGAPGTRGAGAAGGARGATAGLNAAASMMVQPPYLQTHRMDWSQGGHRGEEEASYHTAVDATCHSSAADASYHHGVDTSTHSHSVVDASMHSHSVMDASGHDSLADFSQHGEEYEYAPGKEPRFMEHSCEACKRSKKRCNRRNPCQICTARGIKCVPQVRGPGRPPGSKSNRGSSSSSLVSLAATHSSSRRTGSGSGIGTGSGGGPPSSANNSAHGPSPLPRMGSGNALAHSHGTTDSERSSSSERSTGSGSSSRGRCGLRAPPPRDPWHCRFFFEAARHCKEAFLKAWHENELDTARCILFRNMWAKAAARFPAGVDVTFGISEQVQEAVGPPPAASAPPATSPATRSRSHAEERAKELKHPGSRDGMGTWCLPEELRRLDDGASLLCGYMHCQEETLVYTDEKFAATFMGREEVAAKVESLAVLPILLLAEIFHPDDLPDVYAAIGAHWFRKRRGLPPADELTPEDCRSPLAQQGVEASWICKCVDKRNNEFLALARFRSFVAAPDGYPGAALLAIRPLQTSKYLADPDAALPATAAASSFHRPLQSRRLLRDTFGALPTHMEYGEYGGGGGDLSGSGHSNSSSSNANSGDAAFRPLRRGTTVLSPEGGPKPVPGASSRQQQHMGGSLHGGAPHQGGMSWGGMGGVGAEQHHQQPQPHSFHPGSSMLNGSYGHPAAGGAERHGVTFAPVSAPAQPAALTEAQMFLLQGGPLTMHGEDKVHLMPQQQQAAQRSSGSSASAGREQGQEGSQRGQQQGGAEWEGDGGDSVGTDLEPYCSSASPELYIQQAQQGAAPLAHSRSSPALGGAWKLPQRASQSQSQQPQHPPPVQSLMLSSSLRRSIQEPAIPAPLSALGGRTSFAHHHAHGVGGGGGGGGSDLDVSCHGPQDPNGYGGLQWTPAPLSNLIGALGGLVKKSIGGGSGSGNGSGGSGGNGVEAGAEGAARPPSPSNRQGASAAD